MEKLAVQNIIEQIETIELMNRVKLVLNQEN